jgi:hypothetical protein
MKEAESRNQQVVDALRREFEATMDVALTVKLVGDVCEENLALVLPALHAADLASRKSISSHTRNRPLLSMRPQPERLLLRETIFIYH